MKGKFITIFGAGPGISHGVAQKFGREGFGVVLVARNEEKLRKQVAELSAEGIEAAYVVADVSDEESLKAAVANIGAAYGHAGMILYNASAADVRDVLEQKWETIISQMNINAGGAFHLMKIVLPYCLKENKGKLFFTGGGTALQGDPQWTSLCVGKAAMRNLIQAFVKKAEGTNVHIAQLTVCGYVNPADKKYSPAAIAEQYWKLFNQKPGEFENEVIY